MMNPDKDRRARRRQKTLDIARRRRDEHLSRTHFDATTGLTQVDCVCELSNTFFAKRSAYGCGCRKRRKGQPKLAGGLCKIDERERIYKARRERRLIRQGYDPDRQRSWPRPKRGPKPWVVEARSLDKEGEPRGGWWAFRRYRTRQGAADAARSLSTSKPAWKREEYRLRP